MRIGVIVVFSTACLYLSCSEEAPTDPVPQDTRPNVHQVPSEFPSLSAAISAATSGDTILVADGEYTGVDNRNLTFDGKSLVLMSENGPRSTIINLDGPETADRAGFTFTEGEDEAIVDGFTIREALTNQGGAFFFISTSPTIRNCVVIDNEATTSGGAVRCKTSSPSFINCTFVSNQATIGGAFYLVASQPILVRCIIAFSKSGPAMEGRWEPMLECCNVFGNDGGDWTGTLLGMDAINGNLGADPQFIDRDNGDFRLLPTSPCAPANSPCGELIGALGVAP